MCNSIRDWQTAWESNPADLDAGSKTVLNFEVMGILIGGTNINMRPYRESPMEIKY